MTADSHNQIMHTLGAIEATQKAILDQMVISNARLNTHAARISSLERWKTYTLGVVAAAAAILGLSFKE